MVKSCEKCYILYPQYVGQSKGSDKSRKEEIGFTLFILGFVKRIGHAYPPRFKFSPAKLGQAGH